MDASKFQYLRAQQLAEQALALTAEERIRFLDEHCHDPALRSAVEALLSGHEQTGSWHGWDNSTDGPKGLTRGEETSVLDTGSTERPKGAKPPGSDEVTLTHARSSEDSASRGQNGLGPIGDYEVIEEIARGGMGVVYKARHRILERLVALKIPHASALYEGEERFLREAKSAAALRHANVCPIYEVGHTGRHPFIALGFVEGWTLNHWWHEQQPNARLIAETIAKAAHAVHYAHQHGVIHRDLKPSNIMVDRESGEPILMDFGLAKQLSDIDSQVTQHGQVVGTPAYMAPEQAAGRLEEIGPLSDVYSMGAVLYVLLTGRPPFEGAPGEIIGKVQHEEPVPPHKRKAAVHRDLATICMKAMAKNPAARYCSAKALADDLERFSAGEPILARREHLLVRGRRYLVRHAAMASLLAVTLLSAGVVAYFASGTQAARTISSLTNSINQQLQQSEWTDEQLANIEARLQQLAEHDAQAAKSLRGQWHRAYADSIRDELVNRPSLSEADFQAYQQQFHWLSQRAPALVPPLRQRLELRLRTWQPVFQVASPFDDYQSKLNAANIEPGEDSLRRVPWENDTDQPPAAAFEVLSQETCQGNVKLSATFNESWKGVSELGLLLHAFGSSGYLFRVRVPSDFTWQPPPPEGGNRSKDRPLFWHVLHKGGEVELEILRDGRLLRRHSVRGAELFDPQTGELSLSASREGNRVSFVAGKNPALVFEDMFPYTGSPRQHYGLWWPPGLALTSLEAMRQPLPGAPSPLERGDELFAAEQFQAALAHYQEQIARANDDSLANHAQFKQALCLMRLDRLDEAAPLLEGLAAQGESKLQMRASCQLWLLRLRQQRYEESDIIFQSLQARYNFEQLAMMVPEEDRREILQRVYQSTAGLHLFQFTDADLAFLIKANHVSELLKANENQEQEQMRVFQLCRGYHICGELERGAKQAKSYLFKTQWPLVGTGLSIAMEGSWMLRQQGKLEEAMSLIDSLLNSANEHQYEERKMLLVERARIHAAKGNWQQAAADLDKYIAPPVSDVEYREFAAACLMRGFLYEREGDSQSASEIWNRGLIKNWLNMHERPQRSTPNLTGMAATNAFLLGTMSGNMNAKEVAQLLSQTLPIAQGGLTGNLAEQYLETAAPAIANMGSTEFGRNVIRRMAFQDMALTEYVRSPVMLTFIEITHAGAAPGNWTDPQRELLAELVNVAAEEFRQGSLTPGHIVQLLLTWKGTTNIFGWQGVASSLSPALRGPIAYVLGHRYRKLNRAAEAEKFFRTALEMAEEGSLLGQLAAAELPPES